MSTNKMDPERMLSPFSSWDVYAMHLHECRVTAKKNDDLQNLLKLHDRYKWNIDLEVLLQQPYEALVLTDMDKQICWVNPGFAKMTGYPAQHAMGKDPKFLQGKNTSADTKAFIRKKLESEKPFAADVINYRKNGEEYICHVEIHPLLNYKKELTHFLALEREVSDN